MHLHNFMRAQELIDKYPEVENLNWTAQRLGVFYVAGLLIGRRVTREGGGLEIAEDSFLTLIDYTNQILESRKVIPKQHK